LSLVLPIYQRMSSESAMGELDKVRESFSLGLKIIAVVVFPLTTFVVLLRMPLFQLFLEHGKFTSQNTLHVSSVFLYLSMAIVGLGFGQMIVCAYCVLKKVKLLLGLSLCGLLLNILLGALLHREMGVEGLALASGASILLTSIFSLGALHKEIGGLNTLYLTRFTAKTLAAALVSGISVWGLLPLMSFWTGKNFLGQVAMIGLSAGIFCMIYILLMSLFKVGEINFILRLIKERMKLISQAQLSKP
jgi:putative peptidoglycan lipid II flippase